MATTKSLKIGATVRLKRRNGETVTGTVKKRWKDTRDSEWVMVAYVNAGKPATTSVRPSVCTPV